MSQKGEQTDLPSDAQLSQCKTHPGPVPLTQRHDIFVSGGAAPFSMTAIGSSFSFHYSDLLRRGLLKIYCFKRISFLVKCWIGFVSFEKGLP